MARNRSLASVSPWRRFLCVFLVALQLSIGIPTAAATSSQINQAAKTAAVRHAGFTATDVLIARLHAYLILATDSIKSALSRPSEFTRLTSQFEEPLIATAPTSSKEDRALHEALKSYRNRTTGEDFSALRLFLSAYPRSGWRVALLTNLGLSYYHEGYFSKAIESWEQAWEAGKAVAEPRGKALVDRAIGELMRMHARLGHAERLEALFKELGNRHVSGPATEAVDGAKEGLWTMQHDPGVAYLCGPMALRNLLIFRGVPPEHVRFLEAYRSGRRGVSLAEVSQLASQATLAHRLVFRAANQPIPVPSIVHWNLSHFAAIVGETAGRFHVQDPTFGRDLWITRAAIESESSGYFLVPDGTESGHWREVNESEAGKVRGMGYTSTNDPNATTPQDPTAQESNGNNGNCGMCGYAFSEMAVSLRLSDTPVGYTPPVGPDLHVTLTYNQREASQPANFSFFNISPKWTLNWLTYVQDDPNNPGNSVSRYVAGGGSVLYSGYNPTNGTFTPETHDASILVLTSSTPIVYQRNLPDGSTEIYSQSNGAQSYPRLIFLSKVLDPAGNTATLNYDGQLRLTSVSDATGRLTTFSYGAVGSPLLVSAITDPFGRSAHVAYDASGRLSKITDVLGLTSQFSYDASSLINAMTTPYGTTQFSYGDNGNSRFLQATDPLGQTERLEFVQGLPQIPFSDPPNLVPVGIEDPFNEYLNYRDTFYWDKHAYAVAAGDYTKARNKHWTHWALNTSMTGPTVESIKYPFENRIWMNYPGQIPDTTGLGTAISGTLDKPSRIARVLDDGTTQLTQLSYNSFGHITDIVDPVGRETQFVYAPNQIDLTQVNQKTSASVYPTVSTYTYDEAHHPITATDASGQVTRTTYNAFGQPSEVTNALGQTSAYQYDNLGYLLSITNANTEVTVSFTYDQFGRVATRTDSEGYTISLAYDNFDRVGQETYPDGTTRKFAWNNLDLASSTDRRDNTTHYTYDPLRNLVSITDPLNRKSSATYYPNGVLQSVTDQNGNSTTWTIDVENRITAKTYANGQGDVFTFEGTTGRLKTITDALNQQKQFTYTTDDQVSGITYVNAIHQTPNVTYAYDPYFRRIVSMTDGSGTTKYSYYPVGSLGASRVQQITGPYNKSVIAYEYDALGRPNKRAVDTSVEAFAYDAVGRPISHSTALGTFDSTYLGQTSQITSRFLRGGNIGTSWVYDTDINDRRLRSVDNSGAARSYELSTAPENLVLGVEEVGPHGRAWPTRKWAYTYDPSYRLTEAESFNNTLSPGSEHLRHGGVYSYGYDQAGNLTSVENPETGATSASYNNLNQVVTFGGSAYSYDANGNLLDDGTRTFEWDAENRLLRVRSNDQPWRTTAFRYDGLSRRIAIVATNGPISTETRYLWCGNVLCQARAANDFISRRYFPEGELITGGAALDTRLRESSASLFYAQDQLGSVRDVLLANGDRVASLDYDPYGRPAERFDRDLYSGPAGRAPGLSTDIRFAGMFYEQNSGLYLTLYRAYDPATARWLSRDPSHEQGGINLYAYVAENPINRVDAYGLCPNTSWSAVLAVGAVSVLAIAAIVATDGTAGPVAAELVESTISGTNVVAEEQAIVNSGAQVLANAAQGAAFEEEGVAYLETIQTDVQDQVSIRPYTESGDLADFRVRLDAVGTDESGIIQLTDFKSSEAAGFTPNQQEGYPLLQQYGGQVVGNNGGLAYPAGADIPPTQVTIIRPDLSGGYSITPSGP